MTQYYLVGTANVQMYSQEYKTIKKNIPPHKEVSKTEYWEFFTKYDEFIGRSESNTVSEKIFVYDKYNNMVGGISLSSYGNEPKYYINEELLLKGLELKTEIKDEKEFVESKLIHEFQCQPENIEMKYDCVKGGSFNVNLNDMHMPKGVKSHVEIKGFNSVNIRK